MALASPLYYWFISGFLKNAFDRLFAVAACGGYRNPKKESVLIMAAEGSSFCPLPDTSRIENSGSWVCITQLPPWYSRMSAYSVFIKKVIVILLIKSANILPTMGTRM